MHFQGLNNQLNTPLPEGVKITFIPAGISIRIKAYLIDFLIRSLILCLFGAVLIFMGKAGYGLLLVVYFIVTWGYYIIFESIKGQTPGKKRYKLKVVQDNGLPCKIPNVVLRNLLRPADSFPFAYVLGIVVMAFGTEFKRLGDWAAGTMVIYTEAHKKSALPNAQHNKKQKQPISKATASTPPKFELSSQEQLSILMFAERSDELSKARQAELADILTPLLNTSQSHSLDDAHDNAHDNARDDVHDNTRDDKHAAYGSEQSSGQDASEQLKAIARFYAGQAI